MGEHRTKERAFWIFRKLGLDIMESTLLKRGKGGPQMNTDESEFVGDDFSERLSAPPVSVANCAANCERKTVPPNPGKGQKRRGAETRFSAPSAPLRFKFPCSHFSFAPRCQIVLEWRA